MLLDEFSIKDEIMVKIAYYRKKRGLTQSEVAEKMGMTRSSYAYAETRAKNLSADFLRKLAEVLDVSPNVFLYENRVKNSNNEFRNATSPQVEPFVTTNKEQRTIMMLRMLPKETFNYFYEEIRKQYEDAMNSDD